MSRLKELRKSRNLTQAELAKILGIAQPTLSGWENDKFQIDDDIKTKIADYFGVTVDYLLGREDITKLSNYLGPVIETKKIPIIGTVKCGPNGLAFEDIDGYVYVGIRPIEGMEAAKLVVNFVGQFGETIDVEPVTVSKVGQEGQWATFEYGEDWVIPEGYAFAEEFDESTAKQSFMVKYGETLEIPEIGIVPVE